MKINNVLLAIAFCILSLSATAQSGSVDIVKRDYPQIYTSIIQSADKQWGNDTKTKQTVIEGQAQAFLDILGSQSSLNGDIMTEAILANSLPGTKDANIKIINDLSIANPFPLLQCDWYKVKTSYQRKAGSINSNYAANTKTTTTPAATVTRPAEPQPTRTEPTTPVAPPTRVREQPASSTPERVAQTERENYPPRTTTTPRREQDNRRTYYNNQTESRYDNEGYYTRRKEEKSFHIGIKVAGGIGSMYNLGDYTNNTELGVSNLQVKSSIGLAAEGGLVFSYKKNSFLMQNETTVQYMQASFKNKNYTSATTFTESDSYKNNYLNLQTAVQVGGYFEVSDGVQLIAAVGPYVAFKLNADYDKYGIYGTGAEEGKYEKYMKDGEKSVNFGVSGMFGADINKFRIALYPSLGLSKIQEKEDYKPFGLLVGFTYFFF